MCFCLNHLEANYFLWTQKGIFPKKILTILILDAKIQNVSLMLFIIMNGIQRCTPFTFANGGNGMKLNG